MLTRILLIIVAFLLIFPRSAYSCEEPFTIKDSQKLKDNITSCKASSKNASSIAKHNLAIHFIKGYGIEKNGKEAISLLTQASSEGHIDSLIMLSLLYLKNDEFKAPKKSIPLLTELAEKEHSYGLFLLAELYAEGEFISQDITYAKDLLTRSDLPESKKLLAKLNEPETDWLDLLKTTSFIIIGFIVISFILTSPNKSKKKPAKKTPRKTSTKNIAKAGLSMASTAKPKDKKTKKLHTHPYHCAWCHITATASSFLAKGDCRNSPSGKHEAISTPTTGECRYCGNSTNTFVGGYCPKSPHQNKHALKEN